MPRFKGYDQNQPMLLAPLVQDCLPSDHPAFAINDLVESLNIRKLEDRYADFGRPAYHPKILLKLLFYCYSQGIRSSRKIEAMTYENNACRYLSGNENIDHTTISTFRQQYLSTIEELFSQVVLLCIDMGIISGQDVSLDSSVAEANASRNAIITLKDLPRIKKQIRKMLAEAKETDKKEDKHFGKKRGYNQMSKEYTDPKKRQAKIKTLLNKMEQLHQAERELKQKQEQAKNKEDKNKSKNKTYNLSDPDCRLMKKHRSRVAKCGYNTQITTENQIVLSYQVCNENSDHSLLSSLVKRTEKTTGLTVKTLKADSAYSSMNNYNYVEQRHIDAYIPDTMKDSTEHQKQRHFKRENFKYNHKKDVFVCPQRKELHFIQEKKNGVRQYGRINCSDCRYQQQCSKGKGRYIKINFTYEKQRDLMRKKLNSKKGKAIYDKRRWDVEPVFGNIFFNRNARRFLCRGIGITNIEFGISCMAHNMLKIQQWAKKQNHLVPSTA